MGSHVIGLPQLLQSETRRNGLSDVGIPFGIRGLELDLDAILSDTISGEGDTSHQ